MTSVDSDTSQDIAEAISLKGGRYLEAQVGKVTTEGKQLLLMLTKTLMIKHERIYLFYNSIIH